MRFRPEQAPLSERQQLHELSLKELEYQQQKLHKDVQATKDAVQSSYKALVARFDSLENQIRTELKKSHRLPHILTVSSVSGTDKRLFPT